MTAARFRWWLFLAFGSAAVGVLAEWVLGEVAPTIASFVMVVMLVLAAFALVFSVIARVRHVGRQEARRRSGDVV